MSTPLAKMIHVEKCRDSYCEGYVVQVVDKARLAKVVALALVQEYLGAIDLAKAPRGQPAQPTRFKSRRASAVIKKRIDITQFHRDGLLFQLIMWIATEMNKDPGDLVPRPQIRPADKGQDSLIVHRSTSGAITVSICEDKATESPRDTIRDKVFPEFEEYENGARDDELHTETVALLGMAGVGEAEREKLVHAVLWEQSRRYRARISVRSRSNNLFKDYDTIVRGPLSKRRGESVHLGDLRSWMEEFAQMVRSEVKALGD